MMKCRALFPLNCRLLRFLHPAITERRGFRWSSTPAWQHRRLLGTVAAREVPTSGRTRKRVSREERKAMVEAYVSEYRMINGGKFPSANNTMKQVGGGYYFVRGILQELEYNAKLPTATTMDEKSIAGRIEKAKGISEVGEVRSCEVLVGTTSTSSKNGILAGQGEASNNSGQKMVDISIGTKNNEISSEHDGLMVDHTAKLNGEVGEDVDIGMRVSTTSVSRISADDGSSDQRESSSNSAESMIDLSIVPHYKKMSTEDENSSAGETGKVNGTSEGREVIDREVLVGSSSAPNEYGISANAGSSSQGELCNKSSDVMVDTSVLNDNNGMSAKDENSTVAQTAKLNGISEVREVLDGEAVAKNIVSNDHRISADVGSSTQGKASQNSGPTMVATSIVTRYNEISAKDEASIAGQTAKVNGISERDSEFPSKPGHHSKEPGAYTNTELGKVDESSSQVSASDHLAREKSQDEPQQTSLWHNLKSFASSIISIWQK